MNIKKTLVLITSILIILLILSSFAYNFLSKNVEKENIIAKESTQEIEETTKEAQVDTTSENQEVLDLAPDFLVYNDEGSSVKLSDYFGKPIVLNFWASWCSPCKNEMPYFEEKYIEYKDNVHFLMVNLTDNTRETKEKAKSFISNSGYSFSVLYDIDSIASYVYQIHSIPTTFFIDKTGRIIAYATGSIDKETLQTGLSYIL